MWSVVARKRAIRVRSSSIVMEEESAVSSLSTGGRIDAPDIAESAGVVDESCGEWREGDGAESRFDVEWPDEAVVGKEAPLFVPSLLWPGIGVRGTRSSSPAPAAPAAPAPAPAGPLLPLGEWNACCGGSAIRMHDSVWEGAGEEERPLALLTRASPSMPEFDE